jgi:hypothetical protein
MKTYADWRCNFTIPDLGTRRDVNVQLHTLTALSLGNCPWFSLDWKLTGTHSMSGCSEEKNDLALLGTEPVPSSPYPSI